MRYILSIRNAAKAIIINGDKVLLNRNQNSLGDMCYGLPNGAIYYDLPGGGQNQYETLEEAVIRECIEESGYTVVIDRLAAVFEEITENQQFRTQYANYAHKVHFVFLCHVLHVPMKPLAEKDIDMLDSEWVDLKQLKECPLYPPILKDNLDSILSSDTPLYLGSQIIQ